MSLYTSLFTVTEVMRKEFEDAKRNFGSKYQRLYAFDPALKTYLITDASYKGIGFALAQKRDGEKVYRLIACGSRALTDAQHNYSVTEL